MIMDFPSVWLLVELQFVALLFVAHRFAVLPSSAFPAQPASRYCSQPGSRAHRSPEKICLDGLVAAGDPQYLDSWNPAAAADLVVDSDRSVPAAAPPLSARPSTGL